AFEDNASGARGVNGVSGAVAFQGFGDCARRDDGRIAASMGSKQVGPMSPVRRKLLEKMLAERGLTRAGGGGIPRREGPGPWPLSSGQQRLWVLEQMQPGGAYNMVHAVRLSGRLDAAALRQALARVVARHEAL